MPVDLENPADHKLHVVAACALHDGNIPSPTGPKELGATDKVRCGAVEHSLTPFEVGYDVVNGGRTIVVRGRALRVVDGFRWMLSIVQGLRALLSS